MRKLVRPIIAATAGNGSSNATRWLHHFDALGDKLSISPEPSDDAQRRRASAPDLPPGRYGVGDLGDELVVFLDWAKSAGMKIWQLLPLNPPGYGNSPYGCHSSYAGNRW
jgi:hypothetical protein